MEVSCVGADEQSRVAVAWCFFRGAPMKGLSAACHCPEAGVPKRAFGIVSLLLLTRLIALRFGSSSSGSVAFRRRNLSLVLFFCLLLPTVIAADEDDDIVMIAHPAAAADYLQRNVARAVFGMRQRTWPDGTAVRVFVLPDSHPVHARFVKEQLEVLPHQLQLSWDRVVFSGTGQAPERVQTMNNMLEQVAATPGGLGYSERGAVDERVRIITLER